MRETTEDLANEAEICEFFASKWKCEWRKLGNGGKYRIDAVLHRGKDIKVFVEAKAHKTSFMGLNLPKYMEMCELGIETGLPVYFLIRRNDEYGFIPVWDKTWKGVTPTLEMTGGTPPGREPLPDDVEPMMMFTDEDVTWIQK
jgi:hypothetical protein